MTTPRQDEAATWGQVAKFESMMLWIAVASWALSVAAWSFFKWIALALLGVQWLSVRNTRLHAWAAGPHTDVPLANLLAVILQWMGGFLCFAGSVAVYLSDGTVR